MSVFQLINNLQTKSVVGSIFSCLLQSDGDLVRFWGVLAKTVAFHVTTILNLSHFHLYHFTFILVLSKMIDYPVLVSRLSFLYCEFKFVN